MAAERGASLGTWQGTQLASLNARCALFAAAWMGCCWALARRVLAGERAARRGRAAAWRSAVLARALLSTS